MNVLVVLSQPPHPEGNAPARCAVGLLRGLASHGVSVRTIAARQHFSPPDDPPPDLAVEVLTVPPAESDWSSRLGKLRRPRSELLEGDFPERVASAARSADVVHLEETLTAWSDLGIAKPSLVHLHYLARRDRSLGPPWRRQFRDVLEFDLAERAAVRRHHFLAASSPDIASALRQRSPRAEVVLAPLSLDPAHYALAPLDGPPTAGVIGTAGWPPTAGAVGRLLERVWPLVRRRVPDARLVLAGRGMSALARSSEPDGIDVLDDVQSASDFLRSLSLLLFPLSRGSGMKVKVLESIASGLPVVTTPAGAEGVDGADGVIVRTEDAELAEVAASLLRDPGERSERGAIARAAFLERYAPTPATEPLIEFYARMADRSRSRGVGRAVRRDFPAEQSARPISLVTKRRAMFAWLGASRLGVELTGSIVVLSPHIDDGVFSVGAAVARAARRGADVTILSVFAGDPSSLAPAGEWDGRAGFRTEGDAARGRREEDRQACALVGAKPVWLPYGDEQYDRRADEQAIWEAIVGVVAPFDVVLVPGFPLMQDDHRWLGDLVARRGLGDAQVGFYVEQPYAARWAKSGEHEEREISATHSDWMPLGATLTDRITKLRACRRYSSQVELFQPGVLWQIARYEAAVGGEAIAWPRSHREH